MRLSKEFLDFLIKLPKDHREFKDYFAKEEKNIQLFKNISDKNQLIEELTYSGHYSQIKESIQEIEAYLLGQYNKEYNKYFEPIRVGTNALLGYLCNLIKEVRDIGNSNDLYITYGSY